MSVASTILRILRFRPLPNAAPDVKKCVMVMAPHTSIYDFILGRLMVSHLRLKACIAIKREFFVFPMGPVLKALGAVPVDRQHVRNVTAFAADLLKKSDEMAYIICPEGTRKRVDRWKRGFYQIAVAAEVPICLTHIDFRSRTLGVGGVFYPTGDYEKDIQEIMKYYYGMHGIKKGCFNLEEKPYTHTEWLKR